MTVLCISVTATQAQWRRTANPYLTLGSSRPGCDKPLPIGGRIVVLRFCEVEMIVVEPWGRPGRKSFISADEGARDLDFTFSYALGSTILIF